MNPLSTERLILLDRELLTRLHDSTNDRQSDLLMLQRDMVDEEIYERALEGDERACQHFNW